MMMIVYLKQNEDYLPFLPGGKYEKWKAAEENPNRIVELHEHELPKEDKDNAATVAARATLLSKRQRNLATLLSIIARKVDQYDFDEVLKEKVSISLNLVRSSTSMETLQSNFTKRSITTFWTTSTKLAMSLLTRDHR